MKTTQQQIDQLSLAQRVASPTPRIFQKLKIIGLTLVTMSGALLAAPVTLPAIIVTIAGYLTVAGTVITAVSQVAVEG
jgi:ABC-type xylose transport system permease subunit